MGEILGNNGSQGDNSYLSFISLEPLQARINTAQTEVTRIGVELKKVTDKYNYCKSHGALWSCKRNTGKTESLWKWYVDSYTGELKTAKTVLATAKTAYNDAIAANKTESESSKLQSEAGVAESEEDIIGQVEFQERTKTIGFLGAIILGLGFAGFFLYKKIKK